MLSRRRLSGAMVALAIVLARAAGAFTHAPHSDGTIPLPRGGRQIQDAAAHERLEKRPPWAAFQQKHGKWQAQWNPITGSPHRAIGRGIRLPGFRNDSASADQAVRRFVAEHPELFGENPLLSLVAARRAGNVWYVRYQPRLDGIPVLNSDWEFRVGVNGKLFAFGADVERATRLAANAPRIVPAVAREAAKRGLAFDPAVDRVEGGEELYYLPYPTEHGEEQRLVYRVVVHNTRAPAPGNWVAYVDAADGRVLWRFNRVRYDVAGTVTGLVHPHLVSDTPAPRPLVSQRVVVGGNVRFTDALGRYSGPGPASATVTAFLSGPYVNVLRDDGGANASFSATVANPSILDLAWTNGNSHEAERDAFFHVNEAHAYLKRLEPGFTGLDYVMPCKVNIAQTCNAYWDGTGVNFFVAGGGCPNTATIPDVVYHEYGHAVNDYVYLAHGSPNGMINGALHEGLADVHAAFLQDDPRIGVGFGGPGTVLRTADNTMRYPENAAGDPHVTGEIIAGAFWDLRQAIGLAAAERLVHYAKHGVPDDVDDGIAMSEFFTETLVADDDDADLSNGTPHSDAIIAAFNAHGIGTGFSLTITHTPIADRAAGGAVPVKALVRYTGAIGSLDAGSPTLHYSINGAAFATAALTPTGMANEFGVTIPPVDSAIVRYYVTARDSYGQGASSPRLAPADVYTVVIGSLVTMFQNDMESVAGWTGAAAGDDAVTGRWVRSDPVGSLLDGSPVQPEEDHTPNPGVQCWVTGNGPPGGQAGAADVDNGKTTLLSPVFDASPARVRHPVVEYWRWYTNHLGGAPGTDAWQVELSSDGGSTWTVIENTTASDASWRRVVFRIEDYLTPTSTMRMRFTASDYGTGSLVEAAVDDFRLRAFATPLMAVGDPPPRLALDLAAPSPNPFRGRTTLRFTLPSRGAAALSIFDVHGRLVRATLEKDLGPGVHEFAWDGSDAAGARLPSGAYFVRLEHGGRRLVRRVVRLD